MVTVSCNYLKTILTACIACGASAKTVYGCVQGGEAAVGNASRRFDAQNLVSAINMAVRETGDQNLGLRIGQNMRPDSLDDIGYALTFCDDLKEVMSIHKIYQVLNQNLGETSLKILPDVAIIKWEPFYTNIEHHRYWLDTIMAGYATIGRWLLWNEASPIKRAEFCHSEPDDVSMYHELFGSNVVFNAPAYRILIDPELVNIPIATRNPEIKRLLVSRLERQLAGLGSEQNLTSQARRCIMRELKNGRPTIDEIAKNMGQSERSFRRHLADEGISFRQLLDSAYKEICEIHIRDRKLSQSQIALTLGFSDQSAYTRAFKRWFAMTPKAYERRIAQSVTHAPKKNHSA